MKTHLSEAVLQMPSGDIGTPAVEPLIAALKDKDSSVRVQAADALGKIKGARAVGS